MRTLREDHGFSLIEVLAALLVLATGAVGMAGLVTLTAASSRAARVMTSETTLASEKIEQLRALTWAYDSSGVPLTDWTTDVSVQPPSSGGSGLSPSPSDSLDRNIAGFVDFLDAAGRWVAGGTVPPRAAVFVRRWSISPLPSNPANSLVIQVLVTTVGRGRSVHDALMKSILTRSVK